MKRYIISYDLIKPEKDYQDLLAYLRKLGATRVLASVWLLKTATEPGQLRTDIRQNGKMDSNDRILIAGLTGAAAWHRLLVDDTAAKNFFTT